MKTHKTSRRVATWAAGAALVGAGLVGGATVANAATSNPSPSPSSSSSSSTQEHPDGMHGDMPDHGSAAHESGETPVTGPVASKAAAAAVKAVGSGRASRVTHDFTHDGYEVTVTKSDGSTTEVHLDNNFQVHDAH